MADGPSLAVNVSGILQIASKITQISYSHARDVHRAPITQKAYLQGISALMEVLLRTEEAIRDTEATGLLLSRPAYLNDDLLADCHGQLTDLYIELQKHISELRWPLQDKEVREKVDMLRKYRSLFADFLSACVSCVP
ncbi:hypothetical protein BO94DRAFT_87050 [Aspergillus sclerotioniger CBS 115572]|uniref:NACHT-NTPase and P-loop NTPases N-terminal domain-containing protein n=1 Tax=Aspergillus sclerotioniger CBS 115572 TaxID=1450535 RepID=A0A317WJR3_9EURO|nr:hypothetical protein BO94DRAFT_87050 [Aspergillus sclerotioniger CBS 115572]PWY86569.1 hypothetical protein BO94DRAFT_87050 [Aspergillus sclerotioniger CBS 115572]